LFLQYSITQGLPITFQTSWLLWFSIYSIGFIGAVCFECAIIIFITSDPDHPAPKWLHFFIAFNEKLSSHIFFCHNGGSNKSVGVSPDHLGKDAAAACIEIADEKPFEPVAAFDAEEATLSQPLPADESLQRKVRAQGPDERSSSMKRGVGETDDDEYTMTDFGRAVDGVLRLLLPILYAVCLAQTLPVGILNLK